MAQYGYGGQPNPFDDRAGGGDAGGYGGGLPSGPRAGGRTNAYGGGGGGGYNDYASNNVEMAPLAQSGSTFGLSNPNAILNECADIGRGIDTIDRNLNQMKMLQDRSLNEADSSASGTTRQLDALSSETMAHYRTLVDRVRKLKSNPESQTPKNQPQVQRIDRRLKEAINAYQQVEAQFRRKNQDQMARQYRIVRPEADESEVRAAVDDPTGGQVFQQALMQSNRRGQAQSVLSAVQDRHAQLQKIEQQLIELAQLFQDMDTLVVQQEELVTNIEQKAEETVENFDKGNEEVGTAINTARKTRKKKWICLAIVVAIIVVIVIIVVVYIFVTKKTTTTTKRDIKATLHRGSLAGRAWDNSDAPPQMLTRKDEADDLVTRFIEDTVQQASKRDIKLFRGETARVHARSWQDARMVDVTGKVELEEMMS
ncbi:putative t-SNARE coiled-coil-like protein [Seiridium unicorne]|uniref:t-SNARE coiled-coil-like protein n=1 Tax=Seiridium unicorne TaxID=138068 RepID=A0ABR2V0D6_9PEZI